jgi:hypothetical protein
MRTRSSSSVIGKKTIKRIANLVTGAIETGIALNKLNQQDVKQLERRHEELETGVIHIVRNLSRPLSELHHFGIEDWNFYRGISLAPEDAQIASILPWSEATLNSPCPFYPGKLRRETHMALLGVRRMTIMDIHSCYAPPRLPHCWNQDPYYAGHPFSLTEWLEVRWYLLLKNIVPNSEFKPIDKQVELLPKGYETHPAAVELTKNLTLYEKYRERPNANRWANTSSRDKDGNIICVSGCCLEGLCEIDGRGERGFGTCTGLAASMQMEILVPGPFLSM